jgi:hypothetical protein
MSKVNKNSGGLGNSPSILDSKSSGGFNFSGGAGGSCNSCINHTFNDKLRVAISDSESDARVQLMSFDNSERDFKIGWIMHGAGAGGGSGRNWLQRFTNRMIRRVIKLFTRGAKK